MFNVERSSDEIEMRSIPFNKLPLVKRCLLIIEIGDTVQHRATFVDQQRNDARC